MRADRSVRWAEKLDDRQRPHMPNACIGPAPSPRARARSQERRLLGDGCLAQDIPQRLRRDELACAGNAAATPTSLRATRRAVTLRLEALTPISAKRKNHNGRPLACWAEGAASPRAGHQRPRQMQPPALNDSTPNPVGPQDNPRKADHVDDWSIRLHNNAMQGDASTAKVCMPGTILSNRSACDQRPRRWRLRRSTMPATVATVAVWPQSWGM